MRTMLRLSSLSALVTLIAFAPCSAALLDSQGVYRYDYGSGVAPVLYCSPTVACELTLGNGESVYNTVAGDTVRWIIAAGVSGPHGSTPIVFFKPTEVGTVSEPLRTNLIVTTNERTYEVTIQAASSVVHRRYGFSYPQELVIHHPDPAATSLAAVVPSPSPSPDPSTAYANLDFAYRISGTAEYRPLAVWNDTLHTYLKLPPRAQSPSIYVVTENGQPEVVNFHPPQDDIYIVDGTPEHLQLIGTVGKRVPVIDIVRGAP